MIQSFISGLASELEWKGIYEESIVILKINGKRVAPETEHFETNSSGMISLRINIEYGFVPTFRAFMDAFNSNGSISISILALLSQKSAWAFRNSQADNSVVKNHLLFPDHILLTMAGIKALTQYFSESKKIWMLVERKARKFILS